MDKILDFLDRLCLDEKLYWRVPYLAKEGSAEIAWRREARPSSWSLRPVGQTDYISYSREQLMPAMAALGLDTEAFRRQAGASILTQAVFASMVTEGAVDLFGAEAVEKSVRDTRSFLSGVSDAAARMQKSAGTMPQPSKRPTKAKTKLRLVAFAGLMLAAAGLNARPAAAGPFTHSGLEHYGYDTRQTLVDVGEVNDLSIARVLLPGFDHMRVLPFVGMGMALNFSEIDATFVREVWADSMRMAVAVGILKDF